MYCSPQHRETAKKRRQRAEGRQLLKYPEIYAACLKIAAKRLTETKGLITSMSLIDLAKKQAAKKINPNAAIEALGGANSQQQSDPLPPSERDYIGKIALYASILYFEAVGDEGRN